MTDVAIAGPTPDELAQAAALRAPAPTPPPDAGGGLGAIIGDFIAATAARANPTPLRTGTGSGLPLGLGLGAPPGVELLGQVLGADQAIAQTGAGLAMAPRFHQAQQTAQSLPPVLGGIAGLAQLAQAIPTAATATRLPMDMLLAPPEQGGLRALFQGGPDALRQAWHEAPELGLGQKYAAEQLFSPLNLLPGLQGAPVVGPVAEGVLGAMQAPVQGGFAGTRWLGAKTGLGNLADSAQAVRMRRQLEDALHNMGSRLVAAGEQPTIGGSLVRAFTEGFAGPEALLRAQAAKETSEDLARLAEALLTGQGPTPPEMRQAAAEGVAQAIEATLPRQLAGAQPRYGYGARQFTVTFETDVDKALYIVAQTKASRANQHYLAWLENLRPDLNPTDFKLLGRQVRDRIKTLARDAPAGDDALTVPRTGLLDVGGPPPTAAPAEVPVEAIAQTDPARFSQLNNWAQQDYRWLQATVKSVIGDRPPAGEVIELRPILQALDPRDQSAGWVAQAVKFMERGTVMRGQVEPTATLSKIKYSQRTGAPVYTPETSGQLGEAVKQMQGDGLLPPGEEVRQATVLRWLIDQRYGDVFPSPPPGEERTLWAAVQRQLQGPTQPTDWKTIEQQRLQELRDAREALRITKQELQDPNAGVGLEELGAARARAADISQTVRQAADATQRAGPLPDAPLARSPDELRTIEGAHRFLFGENGEGGWVRPDEKPFFQDAVRYLQEGYDAVQDDLLTAQELLGRAQRLAPDAHLTPTSSLETIEKALRGPDLFRTRADAETIGQMADLRKRLPDNILDPTADVDLPAIDRAVRARVQDLNLNLHQFEGPALWKGATQAVRTVLLSQPGYHVRNVVDMVIRSLLDFGDPGFTAGARPYHPKEMVDLWRRAWVESTDPTRHEGAPVFIWQQLHPDVPWPKDAIDALDPAVQELARQHPGVAAPMLGLGPGVEHEAQSGLLGLPLLGHPLRFHFEVGHQLERSARMAAFTEEYGKAIQEGLDPRAAYDRGVEKIRTLHFDYTGDLTNFDKFLRHLVGFHVFSTRNLRYYIPMLASNPLMVRTLMDYERWAQGQANEGGYGNSAYLSSAIPLNMQQGPGGAIAKVLYGTPGRLLASPMSYFAIGEQLLGNTQDYTDISRVGQGLNELKRVGLGPAPWVDIPLQWLGVYGAKPPATLTPYDKFARPLAEMATGAPQELPWQQLQAARIPGQREPNAADLQVRYRLAEMALERRPDFALGSPGQPIAPEYVAAMVDGPRNPLYQEAVRDLAQQRLALAVTSWLGIPLSFQREGEMAMGWAEGTRPRAAQTGPARDAYTAQRAQDLLAQGKPEALPLLTARNEAQARTFGERGGPPNSPKPSSKGAWAVEQWKHATPARRWALLQSQDPEIVDAIVKYRASQIRIRP